MKPYAFLLMVLLGFGCGNNGNGQGEVIPTSKMCAVLWDIIQVDEYATSYLTKETGRNLKNARIGMYQKVFALHDITQKEFSSSFKYYSGRPDLMKTMFDTLNARGERERKNVYMHGDSTHKRQP